MIRSLDPPSEDPLDHDGMDAAYPWPDRQWLRANFALSADGAAEVDGRSGGIGGPDDRTVFSHLRGGADAILVGSGTVRAENYGIVRLDDEALSRRARRGQTSAVPVAVVTNRADLDIGSRLFREGAADPAARPLVLTCAAAPAASRRALEEVAEVVVCGDSSVDDVLAVAALAERGYRSVLCEGGPTVLARLAAAGLLDDLCLTIAPLLAGPGHTGLFGGAPLGRSIVMRRSVLLGADDGTLFVRYRLDEDR